MAVFNYSEVVGSAKATADMGRVLVRLTQATKRSQQRIAQMRSRGDTNINSLVLELNGVAQSILETQNLLRDIRGQNRRDPRIRPLTDFLLSMDNHKRALSNAINAAIAQQERASRRIDITSKAPTTFGQNALRNPTNPARSSTVRNLPASLNPRAPREPTDRQGPGFRRNNSDTFERQTLKIGRDTFIRDREYQQSQSRFQAETERKVTSRLDTMIRLLERMNSGGGGGGFNLPDFDIDRRGRGRGRGNRRGGGRLGRIGGGLLWGGMGAVVGNIAAGNRENTTGAGATIGGIAGSFIGGPLAAAAGGFIGNDIEESLSAKGKEAQLNRMADKIKAEAESQRKSEALGVAGRFARLKNLVTGNTSISDFLSDKDVDAMLATQKSNTAAVARPNVPAASVSRFAPGLSLNPSDVLPGLKTEETDITVQPRATVIINTDRLTIDNNGVAHNPNATIGSADTSASLAGNFGGIGSGGIYSGSGAGTGAIIGSRGGAGSTSGGFTPAGTQRQTVTTSAFGNQQLQLPSGAGGPGTGGGGISNPYGFAGMGTGQLSAGQSGIGGVAGLPTMGISNSVISSAGGAPANIGAGGQYRPAYALKDADLSDEVVRTIAGEARLSDKQGVDAVINTMFNRVGSKGYGPSSNLLDVAGAPGQFAAFNKGRVTPEQAEMIRSRIKEIASGKVPDNTNGANEFRTSTYSGPWMQKNGARGTAIGGNTFARNDSAPGTYQSYKTPLQGSAAADQVQQTLGQAGTANVKENQMSQAAIRRLPIQDNLKNQLQFAAEKAGVSVEITSGGQPAIGSGGPRTGSTRHDLGGAADLKLYQTDPATGQRRLLDMRNPQDAQIMETFARESVRAGATGIGAGMGYMGPSTMHIGGGSRASWGGADFIGRALQNGTLDGKAGQAEFETWKAQKALAAATPNGPVYDPSKVFGTPFSGPGNVSMASPGTSSLWRDLDSVVPRDAKSRSLGAMMKAYGQAAKENALPTAAQDYSISPKARNFGFGEQGFMPQALGTQGFSSVNSKNAFSTSQTEGSTRQSAAPPPAPPPPAPEPARSAPEVGGNNTNTSASKPVGGGNAPTISEIPTKVEGLGLAALNMPDLA